MIYEDYSLHTYGISTLEDVVTRHIFARLLNILYNKNIPHWLELMKKLMDNENVLLIILDACRYDLFQQLAPLYFVGNARVAKSEGTFLPRWISLFLRVIGNKGGVRIFHATCKLKPHDVRLRGLCVNIGNIELVEIEPSNLVVYPWEVNARDLEHCISTRTVI